MGAITRRHLLALLASAAVLPALAGCETEDCDADDLLEGDDDCDTSSSKSKPKSKPRSRRR